MPRSAQLAVGCILHDGRETIHGLLTDDADLAIDGPGGVAYSVEDDVGGGRHDPVVGTVNSVACWGDTATVRVEPPPGYPRRGRHPCNPHAEGRRCGTVCPTDPDYRVDLLDRFEAVGAVGDGRLTTLWLARRVVLLLRPLRQPFTEEPYRRPHGVADRADHRVRGRRT